LPEFLSPQGLAADKIRLHFAEGIANLHHRTQWLPLLVITKVKGDRIELVPQGTAIRQQLDPALADHDILSEEVVGQMPADVF
jgi:hypothetical protein